MYFAVIYIKTIKLNEILMHVAPIGYIKNIYIDILFHSSKGGEFNIKRSTHAILK